MGLCMNMDNLSSLAHMNICAEFKTGPTLSFPRNMTILHMGSTDNYDIICYMGSLGDAEFAVPLSCYIDGTCCFKTNTSEHTQTLNDNTTR